MLRHSVIVVLFIASSLLAQAPTTPESGPAFRALGDSAEPVSEDRARSSLQMAANLRSMILQDGDNKPAQPATLPPEQAAQMKKIFEESIAQMQKSVDEMDPVKDKELREQYLKIIEQTKHSMAQSLAGGAGGEPAKEAKTLKRPVVSAEMPLDQALASLSKMILDNGNAGAMEKFKASEDYNSATRCAAAAIAASTQNKFLPAIAALIRAHELEPNDPTHLVNLSGITARLAMPYHTLALTSAAEKLNAPIKAAFGLNGKAILLNNRGMALVQLNKLAEAEQSLRAAVDLDPTMAEARTNLAHALFRQVDPKKKEEAIRYARWNKARSTVKTVEDAKSVPPDPNERPEKEDITKPEDFQKSLDRERAGRPPASQIFDLSRGKKGTLLTIKIPRTIGDGAGMKEKVWKLHAELLGKMGSVAKRMNELEDKMRDRERKGEISPIAADRARDIFWYIAHANLDPTMRGYFLDQYKAGNDIGIGTFGGQLDNPWASHELQKKHDEIQAASTRYEVTCQNMVNATEPHHLSWLGPMKNYENAIAKYYRVRYRFQTALAANLYDPIHHEYAKLLIKHQALGLSCEFLSPLMTVTNYDWHFATGWGKGIIKIEGSEDATDEEDEEADMCPAHLKGEYKVKVEVPFLEVSGNCEKVGVEVSVGEWVKAFAEVEYTFEGQISIFIGGAGEASAPGVPVSAGAKAGAYITVTKDGQFVDAGFKTTTVSGIGADVGPIGVGYEREIENQYSLVAAFSD